MRFERQSGVFLHLTSLPGPHGVGDLGAGARAFVDFLAAADQTLWQFCPLGPTAGVHGDSPYQGLSAFAGNPLLIDIRPLAEAGYLPESALDPPDDIARDAVRYDRVRAFKHDRLRTAFEAFEDDARPDDADALETFRQRESAWLEDYTLFRALRREFDEASWTEWPAPLRTRAPAALEAHREDLAEEVRYRAFLQWLFHRQWRDLAAYAADHGVTLVGDVPIYVASDSADVWANPEVFRLDDDHQPTEVAGVPPSSGDDGQRWGNPVYDWSHLASTDYRWWIRRLERLFALVDIARIDHFKGFDEFWAIPACSDRPETGQWRDGPGADFFETVDARLGELPFFVEDLGFLDERMVALRDQFDFPGMRVPQYADWCEEGHLYQPMHFPPRSIGYTSTHDTDTVLGYYRGLSDRQRDCMEYNLGTDGEEMHWDLIEAVWNSEAVLAMTTVQDLHGLGSDARFNVPGTTTGNWEWRVPEDAFDPAIAERLRQVTDRTIR